MTRHHAREARTPDASALDELLQAEREIAAEAQRVAAECDARIAAARAEASRLEVGAATAIEREVAALREHAAADRQRAMAEADRDADAAVARLEQLSDTAILALAERAAARVTGLEIAPSGGTT